MKYNILSITFITYIFCINTIKYIKRVFFEKVIFINNVSVNYLYLYF